MNNDLFFSFLAAAGLITLFGVPKCMTSILAGSSQIEFCSKRVGRYLPIYLDEANRQVT